MEQTIFDPGSASFPLDRNASIAAAAEFGWRPVWSSLATGHVGGRRKQLQHRFGLHVPARYFTIDSFLLLQQQH
jgi:hypothetical protein